MAEENFLLVSLKEDEAKKLAQVISNDTSRRILDLLAKVRDMTESDIAKKLKLPLSTVHYNLQALLKAKLVHVDEFHYSAKGKEVNHYSLASKYVIIAPKDAPETLRDKLRKILPVAFLVGAGAVAVQYFFSGARKIIAEPMLKSADSAVENEMVQEAAPEMLRVAADGAGALAENISHIPPMEVTVNAGPGPAVWFLLGAVFAIVLYIIAEMIVGRKK